MSAKPLVAQYKTSMQKEQNSLLNFDIYSFETSDKPNLTSGPAEVSINGTIINTNTIQEFQNIDYEAHSHDELIKPILQNIEQFVDGKVQESKFSLLSKFTLFTYADLKKHVYSYKFLSPSLKTSQYSVLEKFTLKDYLKDRASNFEKIFRNEFVQSTGVKPISAFSQNKKSGEFKAITLKEYLQSFLLEDDEQNDYFISYIDGFNQSESVNHMINNILAMIIVFQKRNSEKLEQIKNTQFTNLQIAIMKDFLLLNNKKEYQFQNSIFVVLDIQQTEIQSDSKGVLAQGGSYSQLEVQNIDLKSFMDEQTLAREAVDLNIKLMKWRMLPRLNLEKIQEVRCLLVGAGTLGCQLARNLIAWGVQNIDFIDNGKVSYSNPVRQTLYDFEDSTKGGQFKAETAAEKLKAIYPQINSTGYTMNIPMPGHYVTTEQSIKLTLENLHKMDELVQSHDAIFLLTDNRESRWLPTVLANVYDKICITVGLGFDSFVIIRHGSSVFQSQQEGTERLACYFCNDIISPSNSMKDRTLDQQCTVTRPGLSFISSAYASELFISLIHHPLMNQVGGNEDQTKLEETDLGLLPQHIRGSLSDFETKLCYGTAFENCVGCSKFVADEFMSNQQSFIIKVCNDPDYLQKVTNLDQLCNDQLLNQGIIEVDDEMLN